MGSCAAIWVSAADWPPWQDPPAVLSCEGVVVGVREDFFNALIGLAEDQREGDEQAVVEAALLISGEHVVDKLLGRVNVLGLGSIRGPLVGDTRQARAGLDGASWFGRCHD